MWGTGAGLPVDGGADVSTTGAGTRGTSAAAGASACSSVTAGAAASSAATGAVCGSLLVTYAKLVAATADSARTSVTESFERAVMGAPWGRKPEAMQFPFRRRRQRESGWRDAPPASLPGDGRE